MLNYCCLNLRTVNTMAYKVVWGAPTPQVLPTARHRRRTDDAANANAAVADDADATAGTPGTRTRLSLRRLFGCVRAAAVHVPPGRAAGRLAQALCPGSVEQRPGVPRTTTPRCGGCNPVAHKFCAPHSLCAGLSVRACVRVFLAALATVTRQGAL